MKSLISISTVILLGLILAYHALEVQVRIEYIIINSISINSIHVVVLIMGGVNSIVNHYIFLFLIFNSSKQMCVFSLLKVSYKTYSQH